MPQAGQRAVQEVAAVVLALDAVDAALDDGWEEAPRGPPTPTRPMPANAPDDWEEEPVSLAALGLQVRQTPVLSGSHPLRSRREPAPPWRLLKRPLSKAGSAASIEAQALTGVQVWEEEPSEVLEVDARDVAQSGGCGFTVVLRRPPPGPGAAPGSGPPQGTGAIGMCHHFTWDGKHCASAGLPSEHANRCAGHLYMVSSVADTQLCRAVGMQRACSKVDTDLVEVACGPPRGGRGLAASRLALPASLREGPRGCCRRTCPFLAEASACPYTRDLPAGSADQKTGKPILFRL